MTGVVFDHVRRGRSPERPGHRHGSVTFGDIGVTSGAGLHVGVAIGVTPGGRSSGLLSATAHQGDGEEEAGKVSQHATSSLPPFVACTHSLRRRNRVAQDRDRGWRVVTPY